MLAGTYVSKTCAVVVIIMKTYAVHMGVLHVCKNKKFWLLMHEAFKH